MLLILILAAVTLMVALCLIGFAVKAAKKDSVWKEMDENTPQTTKFEAKREAWVSEAASEGLRARGATAGTESQNG